MDKKSRSCGNKPEKSQPETLSTFGGCSCGNEEGRQLLKCLRKIKNHCENNCAQDSCSSEFLVIYGKLRRFIKDCEKKCDCIPGPQGPRGPQGATGAFILGKQTACKNAVSLNRV